MSNIEIWYKRKDEDKHHRITRWINRNNNDPIISWKKDINNKLFQFSIKLYNPLDEDDLPFTPDVGDEFTVTDWQNNVFMNFSGIAEDVDRNFYGLNESGEAMNKYYDILVQSKDFSTAKGTTEKLNSSYINDLLPEIFANTPSLGGILQNGIVIPKHDFGGENFLLPPLKLAGSQYERLAKILELVGWSFTYFYFSELSETNGLHKIKQISMFPKNQGKSPPSDWIDGITFQIYKQGCFLDRDYPNVDDDDIKLIICERDMSYKKSNRNLKNSIELKLNVKSNTNGVGEKFRQEVTEKKNTFDLGGAFDVNSIAIEVITNISSVVSDSVFTITEEKATAINYYQERMNNNSLDGVMRCRINSSGTDYDRIFTLNVSTNTITLTSPISGLVNGSLFTLTGAYDLLMPNLTSYPADGNGYVIKTVDSEKTTVKFTDYDMPNLGRFITGYYFPIENNYKTKNDTDSINKLGFRGLEDEIKEPITEEQAEELLTEYRKLMKPLESFVLKTSHRKNILDLNTSLNVDFEDIKGKFIVTASEGRIIHDEGFYENKPLILQDIEISTYAENTLADLMNQIQNNSKALTNLNLKNNVEEIIHASIFIREVSDLAALTLLTPEITGVSDITADKFTLEFLSSNTSSYLVDISDNINFTSFIKKNSEIYVVSAPNNPVSFDFTITGHSYPLYARIRALRGTEISNFSNTQLIDNSGLVIDLNFNQSVLDQSGNSYPVSINDGAALVATGIVSGATQSLQLDGINAHVEIPYITDFSNPTFTVEFVFSADSLKTYLELISRYFIPSGSGSNAIFSFEKSADKFLLYLYNNTYHVGPNVNDFIGLISPNQSISTSTTYVTQFSYNDTAKSLIMKVNNVLITLSYDAGNVTNLNDLALNLNNSPLFLGYLYNGGDPTPYTPNIKIHKFRYWKKSFSSSELSANYLELIAP